MDVLVRTNRCVWWYDFTMIAGERLAIRRAKPLPLEATLRQISLRSESVTARRH
jgi:hypothetical protein